MPKGLTRYLREDIWTQRIPDKRRGRCNVDIGHSLDSAFNRYIRDTDSEPPHKGARATDQLRGQLMAFALYRRLNTDFPHFRYVIGQSYITSPVSAIRGTWADALLFDELRKCEIILENKGGSESARRGVCDCTCARDPSAHTCTRRGRRRLQAPFERWCDTVVHRAGIQAAIAASWRNNYTKKEVRALVCFVDTPSDAAVFAGDWERPNTFVYWVPPAMIQDAKHLIRRKPAITTFFATTTTRDTTCVSPKSASSS